RADGLLPRGRRLWAPDRQRPRDGLPRDGGGPEHGGLSAHGRGRHRGRRAGLGAPRGPPDAALRDRGGARHVRRPVAGVHVGASARAAIRLFLALFGIERFLIEFVRAKDDRFVLGLTTSQAMSLLLLGAAVYLWTRHGTEARPAA